MAMNPNLDIESRYDEDAALSIGDVVAATGVGEATLRAWERRFGFPSPRREPSRPRLPRPAPRPLRPPSLQPRRHRTDPLGGAGAQPRPLAVGGDRSGHRRAERP